MHSIKLNEPKNYLINMNTAQSLRQTGRDFNVIFVVHY